MSGTIASVNLGIPLRVLESVESVPMDTETTWNVLLLEGGFIYSCNKKCFELYLALSTYFPCMLCSICNILITYFASLKREQGVVM